MKKKISILLAAILIFSIFCGCSNDKNLPEEEILSFVLPSDPETLDPQIVTDYSGIMLVTNLFEGLVRMDSQGSIKSGIAESWDVSDDGLSYTFHLYDASQWSNGTPVTAEDFVFGIVRSLSPETNSTNATDLFAIKNAAAFYNGEVSVEQLGLQALDDSTLLINLEYETDNLLIALTEPAAMPCNKEFFESTKGKYGKDYDLIITNGPFCIRQNYGWDHDKYIYIRRSENYKGGNTAIPLGVNFTYSDRSTDAISMLDSGEVDFSEIYGSQLDSAYEKNFNVLSSANTLWGICYNTDIKAFKNAKLRVSLLESIDREKLLANAPQSYVKTSQLISEDVLFAGINYRDTVGEHSLNYSEDAPSMFNAAVKDLAENEIELKSSYTIIYLDDQTSSQLVSSIIEEWNKTTSCYFNKEALPRNQLEQRLQSGDYEIAIAPLNTAVESPMEFFSKFVKDSPDNYINLNYPTFDEFMNTALRSDSIKSIEALDKAEAYLVDYGYLYPLYYEMRYFASPQNVSGFIFSGTNEGIDFSQVTKLMEE